MHDIEFSYDPQGLKLGIILSATTALLLIVFLIFKRVFGTKDRSLRKGIKSADNNTENSDTDAPTGIDKMMAEDLGHDATIEDIEALLEPKDEFEKQLENNAPTLSKADELLNSQKLDLNAILSGLQEAETNNEE